MAVRNSNNLGILGGYIYASWTDLFARCVFQPGQPWLGSPRGRAIQNPIIHGQTGATFQARSQRFSYSRIIIISRAEKLALPIWRPSK